MKSTFHGHGQAEPIGLEYLAAALMEDGFVCEFLGPHEVRVREGTRETRLSLLSGVSSDLPRIMCAARAAKRDGCTTVAGGCHVSGCQSDVSEEPFDVVVKGEGERVVVGLARACSNGADNHLEDWRQVSDGGTCVIEAPRVESLDTLAFPQRCESRLGTYVLHDLMWPPESMQRNLAVVLASRGCLNDCGFCASAAVWGRGPRFRSPDNFVAELQDLKCRFDTNTIVIIDQSFGQEKQWTLDVCRAVRKARLGMNWYHQSNLTVDREVLRAMAQAGCTKIGFGLEGISPRAVERIKPPNPTDFDEINDILDFCNSLGMLVKLYLMIGFPWETEETVREYLEWIPWLRGNQVKISYMTPFPGTAYWERYSGQLVTRDWGAFDTVSMPVVYNPSISVERYHKIRKELFQAYYGSRTYADVTREMLRRFPHYRQSYEEFVSYLRAHEMIRDDEVWLGWVRPAPGVVPVP